MRSEPDRLAPPEVNPYDFDVGGWGDLHAWCFQEMERIRAGERQRFDGRADRLVVVQRMQRRAFAGLMARRIEDAKREDRRRDTNAAMAAIKRQQEHEKADRERARRYADGHPDPSIQHSWDSAFAGIGVTLAPNPRDDLPDILTIE